MSKYPAEILELNEALFKFWNPIGVEDCPGTKDEYIRYACEIYNNFPSDGTQKDLYEYMIQTTEDYIGLPANKKETEKASKIILKILQEIKGKSFNTKRS